MDEEICKLNNCGKTRWRSYYVAVSRVSGKLSLHLFGPDQDLDNQVMINIVINGSRTEADYLAGEVGCSPTLINA